MRSLKDVRAKPIIISNLLQRHCTYAQLWQLCLS